MNICLRQKKSKMNSNNWITVNRKSAAYKPPQKREAPQPSFDVLYPNTLNTVAKKPTILPSGSYSSKLIEGLNKPTVKAEVVSVSKSRLVVRDLIFPEDDFDYNKMVFPPCSNYTKAVQRKSAEAAKQSQSYEEEEYEVGAYDESDAFDEYDDRDLLDDDQEFNADIFE